MEFANVKGSLQLLNSFDLRKRDKLGLMLGPTSRFLFILCLFQKESNSDMVASSSVVWSGRWASFLAGLVGVYLVGLGSHMSRLRHLGWNQCSQGPTSRPLESCHHQCLNAVCGILVYPKVQQRSF